jgi:peptidoglycan-N-acetylglucosamine deacetylase
MRQRYGLAPAALIMLAGSLAVAPSAVAARVHLPPGVLTSASTGSSLVALTFDNGPSPYTPKILHVLNRYSVPVTFFVTGSKARRHPQFVRAAVALGDQIGNRAYTPRDLQSLSTPHVVSELAGGQAAIRQAAGVTPAWFRPPFGDVDARIEDIAASLGLRTVTWSVNAGDSTNPGVATIETNVVDFVRPGSIVLLNDGRGNRIQTVAALLGIIQTLRAEGYRFVTLDQLFGLAPLPPCVPAARAEFARAGVTPIPSHLLYRTWANLLCRATDLGPATSREHRLKHAIIAQDFRETAHMLELNTRTGVVHVVTVWGWAARVFAAHHIKPLYGRPITHAWLGEFLQGVDWGPALKPAKRFGRFIAQPFLKGWALEWPDGTVQWKRHLRVHTL